MEKFTQLAKDLYCRRQWRHGKISPLYFDIGQDYSIIQCNTLYYDNLLLECSAMSFTRTSEFNATRYHLAVCAVQKSRGLLAERLKHHTAEMKAEQKNWEICHSIHIQREIGNKRCRLDRVPFQYQNGYWDLLFWYWYSIFPTKPIFTNTETAMLSNADRKQNFSIW